MADQDRREIERRKRLARLGVSSSPAADQKPAVQSQAVQDDKSASQDSPLVHKPVASSSTPIERLAPPPAPKPAAAQPVKLAAAQTSPTQPDQKPATVSRPTQTIEEWTDDTIGHVFGVTLDPMRSDRVYLESLHDELSNEMRDDDLRPSFHADTVDRAILARLGIPMPGTTPFQHLVESYRRIEAVERGVRRDSDAEIKTELLKEYKRLSVSYAALSVIMPEMLDVEHPPPDIAAMLLLDDQESSGIPVAFMTALVERLKEDDAVAAFFEPVFVSLSRSLTKVALTENFYRHFSGLRALLQHKDVALAFVQSDRFMSVSSSAHDIELTSLLGPYFRLAPTEARAVQGAFGGVTEQNPVALGAAINSSRSVLPVLHAQLFDLTNMLVRHSAETRSKILEYFAHVLSLNRKRHAMQVDAATVASDGFMVNITAVLNAFAEPFVTDPTKIAKIDVDYLRRKPLVQLEDETRLAADLETTNQYYATELPGENNFISHIFFLNVAYHHYGLGAALVTHENLINRLRDMQKYHDQMQAQQPFQGPQAMLMTMQFQRIGQQIAKAKEVSFAYEAMLCDEKTQLKSFTFLSLVASWLLRLVDRQHAYPQKMLALPLVELESPAAEAYRNLPEYFVEDVCEYFLYVSRFMPRMLNTANNTDLVVFSLTFLRSPEFIKNPYLKAKLVEILFNGIRPQDRRSGGDALGPILNSHPFALEHLFPALMGFYIQAESTGASSQFYDKFNIRYHISNIFKAIWSNPAHAEKLEREFKTDLEFFVRFVALLLNDQTYLLDEALSKLTEIHTLQSAIEAESATPAEGGHEEEQRREREQHLSQTERAATSYMQLGTETLKMLGLFTASIPGAFCTPEIVDRLAAMLDYNLAQLVGPRCTELKVKNPEKYFFDPKRLLSGIAGIFLNMADHAAFADAVARDGRSYRKEHFHRVVSILGRFGLRSSAELDAVQSFVGRVEARKAEIEAEEEDLGDDVPDDYLDPLTSDLMKDPVLLPASKIVCDRATIKRHLLNDPTDPFNRAPLKLDDVVPQPELKQKILDFVAEKRAARRPA